MLLHLEYLDRDIILNIKTICLDAAIILLIMLNDNPIDFIKALKSEHKAIISTVHDIDHQSGGAENFTGSIEKLNKITEILFSHLEKEDKQLYPTLLANKQTASLAKKYVDDMERLSCIALDFFKRYCINREGLKIFVEDFISGYSIFKGLLKVRIKREETELYPSYVLLESGVLYSDILDHVKDQEANNHASQKRIFVLGQNRPYMDALTLAIEMSGHQVLSTHSLSDISSKIKSADSNLIIIDVTDTNKELLDLIRQLKDNIKPGIQVVGFSNNKSLNLEENLQEKFDRLLTQPTRDIEDFSDKINKLLNT